MLSESGATSPNIRHARRASTPAAGIVLLVAAMTGCLAVRAGEPAAGAADAGLQTFRDGAPTRVAIMAAVPAELDLLLARARIDRTELLVGREHHVGSLEGHPVILLLAGVSLVNAAASTQAVIDHFDVGAIVFSGIAGGVNPELAIGDVSVPAQWGQFQEMVFARATEEGWDTDGRAGNFANFEMMFPRGQLLEGGGPDPNPERRRFWFPVDAGMLAAAESVAADVQLARCTDEGSCLEHTPRLVVGGNGVSGSVFVNNAAFREYLWTTFHADGVDMETAAVAQVAAANGVPFLGFRSLSDLAGGGDGANQIHTFGYLAADNSAAVLVRFLRAWRGPR